MRSRAGHERAQLGCRDLHCPSTRGTAPRWYSPEPVRGWGGLGPVASQEGAHASWACGACPPYAPGSLQESLQVHSGLCLKLPLHKHTRCY